MGKNFEHIKLQTEKGVTIEGIQILKKEYQIPYQTIPLIIPEEIVEEMEQEITDGVDREDAEREYLYPSMYSNICHLSNQIGQKYIKKQINSKDDDVFLHIVIGGKDCVLYSVVPKPNIGDVVNTVYDWMRNDEESLFGSLGGEFRISYTTYKGREEL